MDAQEITIAFAIFAFAILLIFNNIVMQKAVSDSPNTSYTHIIVNLNILIKHIFFLDSIHLNVV